MTEQRCPPQRKCQVHYYIYQIKQRRVVLTELKQVIRQVYNSVKAWKEVSTEEP